MQRDRYRRWIPTEEERTMTIEKAREERRNFYVEESKEYGTFSIASAEASPTRRILSQSTERRRGVAEPSFCRGANTVFESNRNRMARSTRFQPWRGPQMDFPRIGACWRPGSFTAVPTRNLRRFRNLCRACQGHLASGHLFTMAFDPVYRWLASAVLPPEPHKPWFLQRCAGARADDFALATASLRESLQTVAKPSRLLTLLLAWPFWQMQIKDDAKYLDVESGPSAAIIDGPERGFKFVWSVCSYAHLIAEPRPETRLVQLVRAVCPILHRFCRRS